MRSLKKYTKILKFVEQQPLVPASVSVLLLLV